MIKKIINIYFWTGSKTVPGYSLKGDWFMGVMSFFLPFYFLLLIISYYIEKIHMIKTPILVLIILSILLTIPIYFYYKQDDRGQKIIDYSDGKKINKRSIVVFIFTLYIVSFFILLGINCFVLNSLT